MQKQLEATTLVFVDGRHSSTQSKESQNDLMASVMLSCIVSLLATG